MGANLLGVVVNDVPRKRKAYGYYSGYGYYRHRYGYGYGYGHEYGYGDEPEESKAGKKVVAAPEPKALGKS